MVLPGVRHGYFWEAPEESARVVLEWLGSHGWDASAEGAANMSRGR